MADQGQGLPPELAAALQGGQAAQGAPAAPASPTPPAMRPADTTAACDALIRAIETCATKGPGSNDPRETAELANATLAYAQAYVAIHPGLIAPQGVPPALIAASVPTPPPPTAAAQSSGQNRNPPTKGGGNGP